MSRQPDHRTVVASRAARGRERGRRLNGELAAELRGARLAAGLTLALVAHAAGISITELSRIERGQAPWLSIELGSRLCSILGLSLWLRAYPCGDAVRDGAHVELAEDFRRLLPGDVRVAVEVPIGPPGDLRTWDCVIETAQQVIGVELETRLTDAQALMRRVQLKLRDSGLRQALIVLRGTRSNRRAFAAAGSLLGALFEASPEEVMADLHAGRLPSSSGLVFVQRRVATALAAERYPGAGSAR